MKRIALYFIGFLSVVIVIAVTYLMIGNSYYIEWNDEDESVVGLFFILLWWILTLLFGNITMAVLAVLKGKSVSNICYRFSQIWFCTPFCFLLSVFFLSCINFNKYYYGHDGLFHINRLEGIVKAFEDGQFLTKVYPYTNNGYGYAVSLFYCDLWLYPFALIYKMGVPLIVSYIIMIW